MIYAATHTTPGGTDLPMINLTGGVNHQLRLFDVTVGTTSTPADAQLKLEVGRTTSVGTGGTSLTENANNPVSASPVVTAQSAAVGGTFSGAPAFTANTGFLPIPLHQRGTFRWVTDPKYGWASIVAANNGLELICRAVTASGTPDVYAGFMWEE